MQRDTHTKTETRVLVILQSSMSNGCLSRSRKRKHDEHTVRTRIAVVTIRSLSTGPGSSRCSHVRTVNGTFLLFLFPCHGLLHVHRNTGSNGWRNVLDWWERNTLSIILRLRRVLYDKYGLSFFPICVCVCVCVCVCNILFLSLPFN